MKRMFLLLTAAAMIAASPAVAETDAEKVSDGIAMVVLYDRMCEKLPSGFVTMMEKTGDDFPDAMVHTSTVKILNEYKRSGPIAWCARAKVGIERASANLHR